MYVDRMSPLWVEGQVVEYKVRPGAKMHFLTLRDLQTDTSMTVTAWAGVMDSTPLTEGARVVTRVKPVFWERSGRLNLQAAEIHLQGVGDLLAQIEALRARLAAEGLFADARKKPLPFLPRTIGLICGRNAKAKDDVVVNASDRWPAARFEIREVAVQGDHCVPEVGRALLELDAMEDVDVIVIARGGGAVEDLLPFSDERLVRAAADARTPIVSAIGHEGDSPLLDLVADYRASTPTDAARRIVPDRARERDGISQALTRMRGAGGAPGDGALEPDAHRVAPGAPGPGGDRRGASRGPRTEGERAESSDRASARVGAPAADAFARDAHSPVPAGDAGPRIRPPEDPVGRPHHVLGADQEGRPHRRHPGVGPHGCPGRRRHEPHSHPEHPRHRRLTRRARPGLVPRLLTQRNTVMTTHDQLPDPQSLGYEEARDELVRIVQTLEGGQAPLEDTLTMWERGEALAARCSQILDGAQTRLSERTMTPGAEAR